MEVWDAYDETFHQIEHITLVRGEPIKDGMFHLVCEVLVQHKDKTYLLMQRDKEKTYGGMWEASVGGSALKGETPLACAYRELQEETGITSVKLQEVGRIVCKETHSIYVEYIGVVTCDKHSIQLQEKETIDYRWADGEEIKAMREDELLTKRIQKFVDVSSSISTTK